MTTVMAINRTQIGPCTHLESLECTISTFLWQIVSPLLIVTGVTGNIISFKVWSRKRMRISNSSVFLRFLAITDTGVLLIAPFREFILYSFEVDIQEISDLTCRIHIWLAFSVTSLSAWILSALSVDRLVAVKCPIWTKNNCSLERTFTLSVALVVCSFILNSHMLFYLRREDVYFITPYTNQTESLDIRCVPNSVVFRVFWDNIWPAIILVLFSLGPVICLITCSVILIREMSIRNVIRTAIVTSKQDLKPLTQMLVIVCLFFAMSSLPVCLYLIISPYVFDETALEDIATTRLAWTIVALFLYCNNTFNFVLYCLGSKMFRKEFKTMAAELKLSIVKRFNRKTAPAKGRHKLNSTSLYEMSDSKVYNNRSNKPTNNTLFIVTGKYKPFGSSCVNPESFTF